MTEYISREDVLETLRKANIGGYITDRLLEIPAADVQPVNQWISVKERLPETPEEGLGVRYSDCCLVCDSHDWCGMAYYLTDGQKSWWEFADAQNKNKIDWTEVTHWMPLPKPPKDGEHND